MSEQTWIALFGMIGGCLGTGGVVLLLKVWRGMKRDRDKREQDDWKFFADWYRDALEEARKDTQHQIRKVKAVEAENEKLKAALTEMLMAKVKPMLTTSVPLTKIEAPNTNQEDPK